MSEQVPRSTLKPLIFHEEDLGSVHFSVSGMRVLIPRLQVPFLLEGEVLGEAKQASD